MISLGPDGFTGVLPQTIKEKITSSLQKIFQIIEKEGTLLNSFYKVGIILIIKPDKDIT